MYVLAITLLGDLHCHIIKEGDTYKWLMHNIYQKWRRLQHFQLMFSKWNQFTVNMKFPLLSEFFHQAELGSEKQVAQKIFWLQHWSVQLMKSSSVGPRFHSSRLWFTLKSERSERGAARQLHNLLQIYILKFSLSLTWWHRSKRSSFKSDERQETLRFFFLSDCLLRQTNAI